MKKSTRVFVVAAAVTGLLSGVSVRSAYCDDAKTNAASNATNDVAGKAAPAKKMPALHSCSGQNDCKGLGGCSSGDHGCKFKNSCKGKGGCEITDKDIKTWEKSQTK